MAHVANIFLRCTKCGKKMGSMSIASVSVMALVGTPAICIECLPAKLAELKAGNKFPDVVQDGERYLNS